MEELTSALVQREADTEEAGSASSHLAQLLCPVLGGGSNGPHYEMLSYLKDITLMYPFPAAD